MCNKSTTIFFFKLIYFLFEKKVRDWTFSLDAVGCLRDGRRGGHLRTARTRLRPAQRRGRFLHQRNGEKSFRYFKNQNLFLKFNVEKINILMNNP